ncbi:LysR family transcriptional regulator [Vibrio sp. Isolate31]|uniref:LysR family transcriptional regulator n=1 Tax=unclassified Vibrio TaxID=2614977 RepID=UPI001EFECE12|nr:LysR family transcriptional regulator [Vibrio sp. Isolate32]MCG9602887.1 LysR family transcriptional regulator [Vibrio sp. Isolate31]
MNFTLRQLKYVVVAGEMASVTKAAKSLHVSQPSISSAILHLEDTTGLQLFIRHHAQGLSITPTGKKFLSKAKQLLLQAEDLGHFAHTLVDEVTGKLKIVGFPTFTSIVLPTLMKDFSEKYPQVRVQCDESHQIDIITSLLRSQYELAITYDLQLPPEIEFEPLVELPPYALLSANHPLAGKKTLTLSELASFPMVLLDWPMTRDYFNSLFLHLDLEPNLAYKAQSLNMVIGLVANGLGYTLFNTPLSSDSNQEISGVKAIELSDALPTLRLGIAKVSHFKLTTTSIAFIELFKNKTPELFNRSFVN